MTDAELAHTKELAFWMTERVFMNPISAKFLTEDWRKAFPDEVAVAERMKALVEALEKAQTINAAAERLVRCKGRYHSEQNYRVLAALFGVTTPDLPPLEHENVHYADAEEMEIAALRQRIAELESRTVKLPNQTEFDDPLSAYEAIEKCKEALTAAGIKVEAE